MKIIALGFLIFLALTLSGCAYNGYQHGYAGYSSVYSTGYGVSEPYDYYPAQHYYPQGGVIHSQQHSASPGYPNRKGHGGYDVHRDWRTAPPSHRNSGMRDNNTGRWPRHSSGHVEQQQNHARETAVTKHAWQTAPASGRTGNLRNGSDIRSRYSRGDHSQGQR